jgi:hypothetical protein
MKIKKWTIKRNKIRIKKLNIHNGRMIHMAVSMATLSCLDSKTTEIFKQDLKTATLNMSIIKEGRSSLMKILTERKQGK